MSEVGRAQWRVGAPRLWAALWKQTQLGLLPPHFLETRGLGFCVKPSIQNVGSTRVFTAPRSAGGSTRACVPACAVSVRWLGSRVTSGADGAADVGQPAREGWGQVPTWQLCGQGEPVSCLEAGVMASSSGGCEDSVSEAGARIWRS